MNVIMDKETEDEKLERQIKSLEKIILIQQNQLDNNNLYLVKLKNMQMENFNTNASS